MVLLTRSMAVGSTNQWFLLVSPCEISYMHNWCIKFYTFFSN